MVELPAAFSSSPSGAGIKVPVHTLLCTLHRVRDACACRRRPHVLHCENNTLTVLLRLLLSDRYSGKMYELGFFFFLFFFISRSTCTEMTTDSRDNGSSRDPVVLDEKIEQRTTGACRTLDA